MLSIIQAGKLYMLNIDVSAQQCDATMYHSSNVATPKPYFKLMLHDTTTF